MRWIHGDASSVPPLEVDLAGMTGNVAQVFIGDDDWAATLRALRSAVRDDGWLVFETRNPDLDLLEAHLDAGTVEDDARISARRSPERGKPSDLHVVVRADLEAVECRFPESRRHRGVATVDNERAELRHVAMFVSPVPFATGLTALRRPPDRSTDGSNVGTLLPTEWR